LNFQTEALAATINKRLELSRGGTLITYIKNCFFRPKKI